jgi:hypothetical protein
MAFFALEKKLVSRQQAEDDPVMAYKMRCVVSNVGANPSSRRQTSSTRATTHHPQGPREPWNVYVSWEIARIRLETKAFSRETDPLIALEWRLPLSFRQQLIQECLHRLVEFLITDILEADDAVRAEDIDSREGLHAPLRGDRAL